MDLQGRQQDIGLRHKDALAQVMLVIPPNYIIAIEHFNQAPLSLPPAQEKVVWGSEGEFWYIIFEVGLYCAWLHEFVKFG